MNRCPEARAPDGRLAHAPRTRPLHSLPWLVGGILALGASAGLALNRTAIRPLSAAPAEAPAPAGSLQPVAAGADSGGAARAWVPATVMRLPEIAAPANPFRPAPFEPPRERQVARAEGPALPESLALPPATGVMPAPPSLETAGPGAPSTAAPEAPRPEEFRVVGIVAGEPPLAVVRYQDHTLFLKIGDRVADTWRLVEIHERSAKFEFGERRVEVPIEGGSSE